MKCSIPEISWHNRDPVLSVDIQAQKDVPYLRLATGGTDCHVLVSISKAVMCDLRRSTHIGCKDVRQM